VRMQSHDVVGAAAGAGAITGQGLAHGIELVDVVKRFGQTAAVDHVSLSIAAGEFFVVLGPSGCGKSTLLRLIAGLEAADAGTIALGGETVAGKGLHLAPEARNVAVVFQSYALWPHMSVADNVGFGLKVRKIDAAQRTERIRGALAAVQMEQYADRKPNQLSGGQQQRVALARALVIEPDVLLLDEPLSNLDAKLRNELRLEIRRICKRAGITTVYVTHDQKEALSMADRVALLREGRVVQLGTPVELYRSPRTRFVAEFLGETNLIKASATGTENGTTTLTIDAGAFPAKLGESPSGPCTISIRPEAIALAPRGRDGTLPATIVESAYLGETAQHIVELKGAGAIKVAELNPFGHGETFHPTPGDEVGVRLSPDDIVAVHDD